MGWVKVDEILDVFLPPHCALCGQSIARRPLCAGCLVDLPWLPPYRVPTVRGFDQVWSALAYEYPVDRLITEAKFGKQLATARALGELLAVRRPDVIRAPDLVVPVPLHWRRQCSGTGTTRSGGRITSGLRTASSSPSALAVASCLPNLASVIRRSTGYS